MRAVSTREVLMDEHWLRDNVAQLVLFECGGGGQNTDMHVVIANTHLLFNPKRGDIKVK